MRAISADRPGSTRFCRSRTAGIGNSNKILGPLPEDFWCYQNGTNLKCRKTLVPCATEDGGTSGSGHEIQLDKPQAVIDAVDEVLRQLHAAAKA